MKYGFETIDGITNFAIYCTFILSFTLNGSVRAWLLNNAEQKLNMMADFQLRLSSTPVSTELLQD